MCAASVREMLTIYYSSLWLNMRIASAAGVYASKEWVNSCFFPHFTSPLLAKHSVFSSRACLGRFHFTCWDSLPWAWKYAPADLSHQETAAHQLLLNFSLLLPSSSSSLKSQSQSQLALLALSPLLPCSRGHVVITNLSPQNTPSISAGAAALHPHFLQEISTLELQYFILLLGSFNTVGKSVIPSSAHFQPAELL